MMNKDAMYSGDFSLESEKREQALSQWNKIMQFIVQEDPRTRLFVLNQLRYLTGKLQIKRKLKHNFRKRGRKIFKR